MKLFLFAWIALCSACAWSQRIAAASDVQPILDALVRQFNTQANSNVQVTYGSSGKLAAQIEAGAPFDVFLSADQLWVARLQTRKWSAAPVAEYGRGRLAWIHVKRGDCTPWRERLASLSGRIAIANPDHAPYGLRAQEVLQSAGAWSRLQEAKQVVLAENVSAALQWVTSNAAPNGLVAWTQAKALADGEKFCVQRIPSTEHTPLLQHMMPLNVHASTNALWSFLTSDAARAAFRAGGLADD